MFSRDFTVSEGHRHPLVYYINSAMCLSVRPGADLGFRTSTNGQDLDGRTGSGPETEVLKPGCIALWSWVFFFIFFFNFIFFALNCRRRCCRKSPSSRQQTDRVFFSFFHPKLLSSMLPEISKLPPTDRQGFFFFLFFRPKLSSSMLPEISKLPPTRIFFFVFVFVSGRLAFSGIVSTETRLAINRVVVCLKLQVN